jgi:hypothetical protein
MLKIQTTENQLVHSTSSLFPASDKSKGDMVATKTKKVEQQIQEIRGWYSKKSASPTSIQSMTGRALYPVASLSESEKEVRRSCLSDYQEAIQEYEMAFAAESFIDPRANGFATEMCRRMLAVVEAYVRVTQPLLTSFERELRYNQILVEAFGLGPDYSGSVGDNPIAIKKALLHGNLREKMTLSYAFTRNFFSLNVLKNSDKTMIDQINRQLRLHNKEFQLDRDLIKQDNAQEKGIPAKDLVFSFRNKEKGRPDRDSREKTTHGNCVGNIVDLSLRELRVGLDDYRISKEEYEKLKKGENPKLARRTLKWRPGMDYSTVSPQSSFAKKASALGLPSTSLVCGPSGTTDSLIICASQYLGMRDLHGAVLAASGWMIPAQDHSLHEILVSAAEFGLPYKGLPEDYDRGFTIPGMAKKVEGQLSKKHISPPSHYLSKEYQKDIRDQQEQRRVEEEVNQTFSHYHPPTNPVRREDRNDIQ